MAVLRDCPAPLRLWDGGLVFYGGALAAAAGGLRASCRRRGWRFAVVGDMFAPALALGHAIGRLGCFLRRLLLRQGLPGGGRPVCGFPPGSVAHAHLASLAADAHDGAATPPLHPTQLYESAALLALFVLLCCRPPAALLRPALPGLPAGYGLACASSWSCSGATLSRRFLFQLRAPDLARSLGLPAAEPLLLSTSQVVSLALLAAALVMWRRQRLVG